MNKRMLIIHSWFSYTHSPTHPHTMSQGRPHKSSWGASCHGHTNPPPLLSSLYRWRQLLRPPLRPRLSTSLHPQLLPALLCPVPPLTPRPSWRLTSELCTGRRCFSSAEKPPASLRPGSALRDEIAGQWVGSSKTMANSCSLHSLLSQINPEVPQLATMDWC